MKKAVNIKVNNQNKKVKILNKKKIEKVEGKRKEEGELQKNEKITNKVPHQNKLPRELHFSKLPTYKWERNFPSQITCMYLN